MKAVIPVAGLGTRLLPATKEQPKEMLPVFARAQNGHRCLKPLVQLIFEQLYELGLREFYFIVGREKRVIEDHFTPHPNYLNILQEKGKGDLVDELRNFYLKIENSSIVWVNQPEPKGFGDAVAKVASFVSNEPILVHAGDTYVISDQNRHLKNLMKVYNEMSSDAAFVIQRVEDPRQYGVVETEKIGEGVYKVIKAVEKPDKPPTNLAIMPIYIFRPVIFKALRETLPGAGGEIQLTDAIQKLVDWGLKVHAIELKPNDVRLDIGTVETYWQALELSYRHL
ncbi:MAG: UTP--glucose-1-phosphate uridylyltransferase [Candidatus Aenigmatarchaeota archaeon]